MVLKRWAEIENAEQTESPYDIMLLDWQMPELDGIDCMLALQQSQFKAPPSAIMVTAYGREEAMQEATTKGANIPFILSKPVTSSSLLDAIAEVLGKGVIKGAKHYTKTAISFDAVRQLQGAHVLLVEDNDINQELALELLSSAGITASTAENGKEALAYMNSDEHFDGVLMDIQMPIMDGYEATKALRQSNKFKEMPIIAMTANAMAGDQEKAHAAGMDDHIAKPIDVKEMFTTMAKWITPKQPAATTKVTTTNSDEAITNEEVPKLALIDTDAGLAIANNNTKLYLKLLHRFYTTNQNFEQQFRDAQQDKDASAAKRLAHSLKGVAGSIGVTSVQTAAKQLELACKQDTAAIDQQLANLITALEPVLAELSTLQKETTTIKAQAFDKQQVNKIMTELTKLIEENNADTADVIHKLAPFLQDKDYTSLLEEMVNAADSFDFDCVSEAHSKLLHLLK